MHSFISFLSLLVTIGSMVLTSIPYAFASHAGNRVGNGHHRAELSFRQDSAQSLEPVAEFSSNSTTLKLNDDGLKKRDGSARFTWFNTGLGACGGVNSASDFIVAINKPQWDGGSHCYETVTITYNGKSAQAQIVDECMGCPFNALDLSTGLFRFLVGPSQDQVFGDWSFGGETKPTSTTVEKPTPTTTSSSQTPSSTKATHTSTSVTPTETSTTQASSVVPSTTSSTTRPTSTSSSTAVSTSAASTSASSTTSSSIPTSEGYLSLVNGLMSNIGNIIMQAPAAAARG